MARHLPLERRFRTHVFVSRPTDLTARQTGLVDSLYDELDARHLFGRTVGVTHFGGKSPLTQVYQNMVTCHGALILGLVQGKIDSGTSKPGTRKHRKLRDVTFSTPWNQLEAGIAYAMRLPLMIVKEDGITGGVFDHGAAGDYFVHAVKLNDSSTWRSKELKTSLDEWWQEVRGHARAARKRSRYGFAKR